MFRLGGDEFAVILQRADYENRDELLRTFDRMVEAHNASVKQRWEQISISKGMAVFDADKDKSVEQVLHRADELMYEDKRQYKTTAAH